MNKIAAKHSFRCDLNKGTREIKLATPLMHQDVLGDIFSVSVWRGSSPVELDGVTVRGYLYLAATKQTILLSGSVTGSSASVTLDSSCYAVPGHAALVIQLQKDAVRHTILKANFVIDRTCTDTIIDPDSVIPTLAELLAQIETMEQATAKANEAAASADEAREGIQGDLDTIRNKISADHLPKVPLESVWPLTGGESIVHAQEHITAEDKIIGLNVLYTIKDTSYALCGGQIGAYSEIVAAHPRIRVWLYPKHDMDVCVTFSNAPNAWASPEGHIEGYADTVLHLKANNANVVEFDYTQANVREFYADQLHSQGVGVIVSLAGRHASNPAGVYELEWFITDEYIRNFTADHTSHAEIADTANESNHAVFSENADNTRNAVDGEVVPFHAFRGGMTVKPSDHMAGGFRIQYAVGENAESINILSTKSLGKAADLRDKKLLVKCINRNSDAATDIAGKWAFAHTNVYRQDWGLDKGAFTDLSILSKDTVCALAIDYDACGYSDTDDVYLRINNKGSYTTQLPYSLDVDIVVYIVPANYKQDTGIVVATLLDGFDPDDYLRVDDFHPDEYVRKDEADALLQSEKYITCWGDSLTAQGGWTSTLQSLSGLPVYNGGTGGENVRTIAARQGADVMMLNGIAIPADTTPVTLAPYAQGIPTEFGYKATPLLQGGAHVNPVMLGDIEGTLRWTGSSYNDTTGVWTFTRSKAGEAVTLKRPTAMRTNFDRVRNAPYLMVIYIGQNGGYTDLDDLVRMHRLMIEHSHAKNVVVLGFSSGSATQRSEYEARMRKEFGRYFISLREYLAHPIYAEDGSTIVSCYGLDDAGLTATDADLAAIATGTVPPQLLADSVHYTTTTRTVIGNMLYKRCSELGIF